MGCAVSGGELKQAADQGDQVDQGDQGDQGDQVDQVNQVDLSEDKRRIIKDSWRAIQEDITKVGIIMFVKLFETHPECKDFFLFKDVQDLEKLKASRELRAHGLRIMSVIEKTVARIDHMDRVDKLILDLGRKHHGYSAPPQYYVYVGAEFVRAVQPMLKERWSPEVEEAWQTLFLYITTLMKRGYLEEERNQRNVTAPSSRDRPQRKINPI